MTRAGRATAIIGALFFGVTGLWAFLAPRSFYEQLATWPPYNEHFLHDAGAFQMGLAAGLVLLLLGRRGAVVALGGGAFAAVAHAISHIVDYGEGGRTSDPYLLGALAVVLVVGVVHEWRAGP